MSSLDQAALPNAIPARRAALASAQVSLVVCLTLGLLHGLLYVFLVPPWQHYDEPNHFEYAWLLANAPGTSAGYEHSPLLERQLVESMVASGFYRGMQTPDLSPGADVRLGLYSQLDERPFYYLLVSGPLRLMKEAPLERQLYAGRLISLLFYLLAVAGSWGAARAITAEGSILRWGIPLTVALLPGFVDSMTALNNDSAAAGLISLFLWGCLVLMRLGLGSWRSSLVLLGTILAGALAALAKSTALFALPLLALALILSLGRSRHHLVIGALTVFLLAAAPFVLLTSGDAYLWHRSALQEASTRIQTQQAPVGSYAFLLQPGVGTTPNWSPALFQSLPQAQISQLRGSTATLGLWAWADQPVEVRSPALWVNGVETVSRIQLDTTPRFFAVQADVPSDAWRIWITLHPGRVKDEHTAVYFDGLVLAEGVRPLSQPPVFTGADGLEGEWGERYFANLARNPSAEHPGLRFQPWVEKIGAPLLPDRSHPSLLLTAVLDFPGTGWFYRDSSAFLGRTWWGMFGWGHVPLPGNKPYRWLGIATAAALLGFLVAALRGRKEISWTVVVFLAAVLASVWGAALLRGSIYLGLPRLLWSPARYAAPAILPSAMILAAGGLQVLSWVPFLRRSPARQLSFYLLLFVSLGLISIYTILSHYGKD